MEHQMKLRFGPFETIKSRVKDVEMRLNDEKRKLVEVGDSIRFTNVVTGESLTALVIARHEYPTFSGLYAAFDKTRLGYLPNETAKPEDMEQYYSKEEIEKYGVVGLEIQLL